MGKYSDFYHNWESDGSEVQVQIPNFNNVFVRGSNCGNESPDDYAPTIDQFINNITNAATLSPSGTPLEELHDRTLYWGDVYVLAGQYKSWAINNAQGHYNNAVACNNWYSLTNWFCYKQSKFCKWSLDSMLRFYNEWLAEYVVAGDWFDDVEALYEASKEALETETQFIMETTQIDLMKAELQIAMANAGGVLADIEYQARMNKTKSIFLPIMAVMLVVVVAYLLINNSEKK